MINGDNKRYQQLLSMLILEIFFHFLIVMKCANTKINIAVHL